MTVVSPVTSIKSRFHRSNGLDVSAETIDESIRDEAVKDPALKKINDWIWEQQSTKSISQEIARRQHQRNLSDMTDSEPPQQGFLDRWRKRKQSCPVGNRVSVIQRLYDDGPQSCFGKKALQTLR